MNENMNTRVGLAPRRRRIIHCTGCFGRFYFYFYSFFRNIDERETLNKRVRVPKRETEAE